MGIHAGRPLRTVVHIAEETGPNGGALWKLTLECGHTAWRPLRPIRPEDIAAYLVPVVVMDGRRPHRPKYTAPHRVRCLHCPETS